MKCGDPSIRSTRCSWIAGRRAPSPVEKPASLLGWQAHGMAGIDRAHAREVLGAPDDYGRGGGGHRSRGRQVTLPASLQLREVPSQILRLTDVAAEGTYRALGAA